MRGGNDGFPGGLPGGEVATASKRPVLDSRILSRLQVLAKALSDARRSVVEFEGQQFYLSVDSFVGGRLLSLNVTRTGGGRGLMLSVDGEGGSITVLSATDFTLDYLRQFLFEMDFVGDEGMAIQLEVDAVQAELDAALT